MDQLSKVLITGEQTKTWLVAHLLIGSRQRRGIGTESVIVTVTEIEITENVIETETEIETKKKTDHGEHNRLSL
jgi:hypothetical protein